MRSNSLVVDSLIPIQYLFIHSTVGSLKAFFRGKMIDGRGGIYGGSSVRIYEPPPPPPPGSMGSPIGIAKKNCCQKPRARLQRFTYHLRYSFCLGSFKARELRKGQCWNLERCAPGLPQNLRVLSFPHGTPRKTGGG